MSLSLVRRCRLCDQVITDEDDFNPGDDPELCELCQEVTSDSQRSRAR